MDKTIINCQIVHGTKQTLGNWFYLSLRHFFLQLVKLFCMSTQGNKPSKAIHSYKEFHREIKIVSEMKQNLQSRKVFRQRKKYISI